MKTISILLISSGLAVGAVTTSQAATTPTLLPSAPRTVVIHETETPPVIRAGLLQSTLILLPAEEKVATVFGGDTVSWVFDGGHVASRFISIKPKVANTTTDVHIVSDHGNEYTLQLREVSSDGDPHFDSKVFVTPGDQAGKDKLAAMPVFVPAAELDKAKRELKKSRHKRKTSVRLKQQRHSSIAANTPDSSTLITPGTKRREMSLASSKFGEMTSSPIYVVTFKRPLLFTS